MAEMSVSSVTLVRFSRWQNFLKAFKYNQFRPQVKPKRTPEFPLSLRPIPLARRPKAWANGNACHTHIPYYAFGPKSIIMPRVVLLLYNWRYSLHNNALIAIY